MRRKRRTDLRRNIGFTLVAVALVSVLLLTGLNYVFARLLISDSVSSQLESLRDTRIQAIERGAERLQNQVSTLAATPSVIDALDAFAAGYAEIDEGLTSQQEAELEMLYDEGFEPLREIGQEVPTSSVIPSSSEGRYVQYHYIIDNPNEFDDRDRLDDAGDGSAYSAVHAAFHPLLRSLMTTVGVSDLLLIDADSADVVYSVKKRIDIGTDVADGPWADGALGAVVDELAQATVGDSVVTDTVFYVPARAQAVVFVATAIRAGADVTGAIVAELPVEVITDLVTAGEDWEALGLEDTGDIYLVGADGTLRTDTRAWLDDREGFLRDHLDRNDDDEQIARMRLVGSAVLTQDVDNRAVDNALEGDTFIGTVNSYRGETTFAASGPLALGGQEWVAVVEQDRAEANSGLATLLRSSLVVIAVLIPLTALLGWWLARSLAQPFRQLVEASGRIANGEPASGIDRLGKNELGDVGRQFEVVAAMLEAEEAAIKVEESQIDDVLSAVIPPRLIDRVRAGEQGIADLLDTATVVSLQVDGVPEAVGSEQETVFEINEQLAAGVDRLLDEFGVERVRRSSTNALFAVGLGQDDAGIADAVRFTAAVMSLVVATGAEYGQSLTIRAGLAAGDVASGVVGQQQLSFSMWGEPVTSAFTLASLAQPGEILVDATVTEGLGPDWEVEPRTGLPTLDDDVEGWTIRLRQPADM